LDAQIIYEAAGKMPHGRLWIANELFTKTEKSKIKSRMVLVSQPVRSSKEDHLERENDRLRQDNKRLRGIELVVRVMFHSLVNYTLLLYGVMLTVHIYSLWLRKEDLTMM
jgi:hypothetical protein